MLKIVKQEEKGITLISLSILTIVILIIVVTVVFLTSEIGFYVRNARGDGKYIVEKFSAGEVRVGDFVKYTPDSSAPESFTVSGAYRTSDGGQDITFTREELLWRVLDKTEGGLVRLISETPTEKRIYFHGYNGYNNAVRIIDGISSMYGSRLGTAQNLKIEDVEKHIEAESLIGLRENWGFGTYREYRRNRWFPNIWISERGSAIDDAEPRIEGLGVSEQNEWRTGRTQAYTNVRITDTIWGGAIAEEYWIDAVYHQIFMKNMDDPDYSYWLSSRANDSILSLIAGFHLRFVRASTINQEPVFYTDGASVRSQMLPVRPVVTLNSEVLVFGGNGERNNAWQIDIVK